MNLREQAQKVSDEKTQFHKDYGKYIFIKLWSLDKCFPNLKNNLLDITIKLDKTNLSVKMNFVRLDYRNTYFFVKITSLMTTLK